MDDDVNTGIARTSREAVSQARRLRLGAVITLVSAALLSAVLGVSATRQDQEAVTLAMARSFFDETVALRSWVSEQGGLYAPRSAEVPPNPWIAPELREVVDEHGEQYVLLNPAYLTRLLAARTERGTGVSIRLLSSTPINPDNLPDDWESESLAGIDAPGGERWGVEEEEAGARFRYLATLPVEPSCVAACHPADRDGAAMTLGAISVGFDHAPFAAATAHQVRALLLGHSFVLLVALAVLHLLATKLGTSLKRLSEAGERIGALERLLPICAWCKRIRPEEEEESEAAEARWMAVEDYISRHVQTKFTHGLCPDCATKLVRDGLDR